MVVSMKHHLMRCRRVLDRQGAWSHGPGASWWWGGGGGGGEETREGEPGGSPQNLPSATASARPVGRPCLVLCPPPPFLPGLRYFTSPTGDLRCVSLLSAPSRSFFCTSAERRLAGTFGGSPFGQGPRPRAAKWPGRRAGGWGGKRACAAAAPPETGAATLRSRGGGPPPVGGIVCS